MPGTNFDVDDDLQLFKLNQQLEKLVTSGSILDREKIQKLIDQGADVNSTHRFGDKTPLHIAAWSDEFFIAELLLQNTSLYLRAAVQLGKSIVLTNCC